MKINLFGTFMAVVIGISSTAFAGEGTLLVAFDGRDATIAALEEVTADEGGVVRSCSPTTRICILDFDGNPPVSRVEATAGVQWGEPDQRLTPTFHRLLPAPRPLDAERFGDFYGTGDCSELPELELLRVDEVWEQGIDGTSAPVVAVIDMGFAADHRDLVGRVAGQYDYGDLDDVAEVQPAVAIPHHGTFMAGLIAAVPDNDLGRAGIAPYGQLFLQRVVDSWNNQDLSFTIHALSDIADNHPEVRVVAYSLIPSVISDAYEQAVEALGDAGVVFVAAAGNCAVPHCSVADNDANPLYPMSYPFEHIVTVASTDSLDQLNPWTHYGQESIDLFAPGMDLCSLGVDDDSSIEVGSGTSYAAPIVAGAAALVLEAHPALRAIDVARVLRATVQPLPELAHMVRSGGRLDVAAAVAASVPWIAWPPNTVVDGEAELLLSPVSNYGAAGDAMVVLFHGPEVEAEVVGEEFVVEPFEPGETVVFSDVGAMEVSAAGLLIRWPMDAHRDDTLRLRLRGVELGSSQASVRMVLRSDEGTVLGAPYLNDGSVDDASGVEAHPFMIEVTALASGDGPTDGGPPDAGVEDGGAPDAATGDADEPSDGPADYFGDGGDEASPSRGCVASAGMSWNPASVVSLLFDL